MQWLCLQGKRGQKTRLDGLDWCGGTSSNDWLHKFPHQIRQSPSQICKTLRLVALTLR